VKLVHLVGFIIKKFVTMHSHMNVKRAVQCNLSVETWILSYTECYTISGVQDINNK